MQPNPMNMQAKSERVSAAVTPFERTALRALIQQMEKDGRLEKDAGMSGLLRIRSINDAVAEAVQTGHARAA